MATLSEDCRAADSSILANTKKRLKLPVLAVISSTSVRVVGGGACCTGHTQHRVTWGRMMAAAASLKNHASSGSTAPLLPASPPGGCGGSHLAANSPCHVAQVSSCSISTDRALSVAAKRSVYGMPRNNTSTCVRAQACAHVSAQGWKGARRIDRHAPYPGGCACKGRWAALEKYQHGHAMPSVRASPARLSPPPAPSSRRLQPPWRAAPQQSASTGWRATLVEAPAHPRLPTQADVERL